MIKKQNIMSTVQSPQEITTTEAVLRIQLTKYATIYSDWRFGHWCVGQASASGTTLRTEAVRGVPERWHTVRTVGVAAVQRVRAEVLALRLRRLSQAGEALPLCVRRWFRRDRARFRSRLDLQRWKYAGFAGQPRVLQQVFHWRPFSARIRKIW